MKTVTEWCFEFEQAAIDRGIRILERKFTDEERVSYILSKDGSEWGVGVCLDEHCREFLLYEHLLKP